MIAAGDAGTVLGAFDEIARRVPDRPAVLSGEMALSYGTLREQSHRLARALREDGIRAGDRVALALDNSPDFVVAYLGALTAGAIVVPLNPKAPAAAHLRVFQDCRPVAACVSSSNLDLVSALASRLPDRLVVYGVGPLASPSAAGDTGNQPLGSSATVAGLQDRIAAVAPSGAPELPPADARALIVYTSGTTGAPKGVMLSHANLRHIASAAHQLLDIRDGERIGVTLPLFHLYALRELDLALSTAATIVLPADTHFPARMLAELHDTGVSGLSSVPSALGILIERYRTEVARCLRGLRYLTIGTAPLPAHTLAALRDALPDTRLITTYGLTEASRVCWIDITDSTTPVDPRIVGHPYAGVELHLVDEAGGFGRVAVRSGMVMEGYWANEAATRDVFTNDGLLLTPDCGRIAEDGTLHLLGRMDDVINCGGQKMSPVEIEEALARHPLIDAVTVLGVPDPDGLLGEVPHAVVVRKPGASLTAADVRAHAASALEPHKIPRAVEFVEEIPRSILGKPQRVLLKK
jgi:long-chain acyl-CoA synthetase